MRLVFDPVRHHFMKSITPAEEYVEFAVEAAIEPVADVFNFAAGLRLRSQRIMYNALTYRTGKVRRWITHGDTDPSLEDWAHAGTVATFVVLSSGYLNPWTAPIAASLDAWNLYRHYS